MNEPPIDDTLLTARICRARSLAADNRYARAIAVLATDDLRVRALTTRHPDLLAVLSDLAWWMAWDGRLAESLDLLEVVDEAATGAPDVSYNGIMALRARKAYVIGMALGVADALTAFTALTADLDEGRLDRPELGFHIRRQRARWLGVSGDYESALRELEPLAVSMAARLGEGHREVLLVQSNIAYFGARVDPESTELTELALDRYARLVTQRTEYLGPFDPDTLDARRNYAEVLGRLDPTLALMRLTQLLRDERQVLDFDHRYALATQLDLALMARRLQEWAIMSANLEEVLGIAQNSRDPVGVFSEYGRRDLPAAKLAEIASYLRPGQDDLRTATVNLIRALLD